MIRTNNNTKHYAKTSNYTCSHLQYQRIIFIRACDSSSLDAYVI